MLRSEQFQEKAQAISQINAAEFEFIEVVGSGSFGQVWKGKWRSGLVAIKQVRQDVVGDGVRKWKI
jgi:serine/threonine protein kinase